MKLPTYKNKDVCIEYCRFSPSIGISRDRKVAKQSKMLYNSAYSRLGNNTNCYCVSVKKDSPCSYNGLILCISGRIHFINSGTNKVILKVLTKIQQMTFSNSVTVNNQICICESSASNHLQLIHMKYQVSR